MIRAILGDKREWIRQLSLDPVTGLDPKGIKVRVAQGLEAADRFVTGYWIWDKVINNLAAIGYDSSRLLLASYDWRLAYSNLELRDAYYTRLKAHIELSFKIHKMKTVLVSHSMGGPVTFYFLKWVEAQNGGQGGSDWVEMYIDSWVNAAGPMLGVTKAMAAEFSGEMRDSAELPASAAAVLEKLFSRHERSQMFRTWAGASGMFIKGGDDVWGNLTHAVS